MKKISLIALLGLVAFDAHAVNLRQYASVKLLAPVSNKTEIKESLTVYDHGTGTTYFEEFKEDEDMETVNALSLAYGVQLADARVELEYNHYFGASEIGDTGLKLQNYALFANAYYDFKTNSPFTPYVGAGIGYNQQELSAEGESETLRSAAWKLMVGTGWKVNNMLTLDLGYRYVNFGSTEYSEFLFDGMYGYNIELEFANVAHELMLGARISF